MRRGKRGHECEVDLSRIGLWRCEVCGQDWEIHGIAGHDVRARRISRIAKVIISLLG
jgi:hypothetical protein